MTTATPGSRTHGQWLGLVQPMGLVVAPGGAQEIRRNAAPHPWGAEVRGPPKAPTQSLNYKPWCLTSPNGTQPRMIRIPVGPAVR